MDIEFWNDRKKNGTWIRLITTKKCRRSILSHYARNIWKRIKGVPTVFINDEKFEFNPVEDDKETIQEKLKSALESIWWSGENARNS